MTSISKYLYNIYFKFLLFGHYPSELFAQFADRAIGIGFMILFWSLIIDQVEGISSLRYLAGYYMLSDGLGVLTMAHSQKVGAFLRKSVNTGELSNILIKPVSPSLFALSSVYGERIIESVISIVLIILGIYLVEPASPVGVALFFLFFLISLSLSLSLNFLEGVATFYVTNPSGIMNTVSHVSRILSGSVLPLSLMPDSMSAVLLRLPFAMTIYNPINSLTVKEIGSDELSILVAGLLWSLLIVSLTSTLWKRSLKSYEAYGQ